MTRNQIQQNLEIEQAELRGFARSVAEVEWLLLILVLLYLFVTQSSVASRGPVVATLLVFAAFILLFRYTSLLRDRARLKLATEALVMVAFLTAVLAQTGSEQSPLINLYLLPIIAAALALGKGTTVLVVALVSACYVFLASRNPQVDIFALPFLSQAIAVLSPYFLVAFLTTLLAENINTAKARIRALSDQDELTTVYNIRAFTRLLHREHERAKRNERCYSLAMVDMDRLKSINDTHGHEAGNRAINLVADALLRITRSSDLVARYGGDEFIVYLAEADKHAAEEVAQRIRNIVYATTLEVGAKMERVSVSVGIATFPDDGVLVDQLIAAADKAMYKDKEFRRAPPGKLVIQKK